MRLRLWVIQRAAASSGAPQGVTARKHDARKKPCRSTAQRDRVAISYHGQWWSRVPRRPDTSRSSNGKNAGLHPSLIQRKISGA